MGVAGEWRAWYLGGEDNEKRRNKGQGTKNKGKARKASTCACSESVRNGYLQLLKMLGRPYSKDQDPIER